MNDPSVLQISDDKKKLLVSSPLDNTFFIYSLSYSMYGNPRIGLGGNGEVAASKGSLEHIHSIGENVYALTDNGIHLYTLDRPFKYEYETEIGTTGNHIYAMAFDNLATRAWSIEKDTNMHMKTFSLLGNITYDSGSVQFNNLDNVKVSYSPQGNMMSLTGTSSLYLMRLNDN